MVSFEMIFSPAFSPTKQLIDSKKLFRGDRDKMTEIVNETSKKHWIPHQ